MLRPHGLIHAAVFTTNCNSMPTHHKGYQEARQRVSSMPKEELLELIDDLFGRDNLPALPTLTQIRCEAFRQLDQEFRTADSRQGLQDAKILAEAIKLAHRVAGSSPLNSTIHIN